MKRISALLLLAPSALAFGQGPSKPATPSATPAVHHTVPTATPCLKLPELSPKIPALPAGLPCAKALYTLTVTPNAKVDYASPLEGPALREALGLEPTTFSLGYIDVKAGTGPLAGPHQWYSIHYTGYLTDGTKFDSSIDKGEPITIPYGQHKVITGWDTGFGGMRVGGKRRLFVPFELGYGTSPHPGIPPKSMLIFDVELVAASDTEPPKPAPKPATPPPPPPTPPAAAPQTNPAVPPATPTTPPPSAPGKPLGDPTKPTSTPPSAASTPPATTPKP
jgi:peptidylprolyl isomerase